MLCICVCTSCAHAVPSSFLPSTRIHLCSLRISYPNFAITTLLCGTILSYLPPCFPVVYVEFPVSPPKSKGPFSSFFVFFLSYLYTSQSALVSLHLQKHCILFFFSLYINSSHLFTLMLTFCFYVTSLHFHHFHSFFGETSMD